MLRVVLGLLPDPPAEVLPVARRLAEQIANRPPAAIFETKTLSRELIELDTDSAFTRMFDVITARLRSDEHQNAVEVYLDRLREARKR